MKKLFIYIIFLLTTVPAFAQKDVQAKAILNQVSQKYRSYNIIKSDFTFTVDNPQAGVKESRNGTLTTQSKTNKFKVTVYAAGSQGDVEQEIISDGKSQWTYLKKDKEVQLANADNSDQSFNPAKLFSLYEHGYKYAYMGDQKSNGKIYQVIELSPENDAKTQFFKIRLLIDKVKKQIYSALIFDKSGAKYNYTLRSFTASAAIPAGTFTFDAKAHPGVEVVDLR